MQAVSELLADEYRKQQTAQAAAVSAYVALRFQQIVKPDTFGATAGEFVETVLPDVLRQRNRSAISARPFLIAIRRLEVPSTPATWRPPDIDVLDSKAEDAARASLRAITAGLYTSLRTKVEQEGPAAKGFDLLTEISPEVWEAARASYADQVGAAAARHALNGGRAVITNSVEQDQQATGWGRVTGEDCCFFCALLATRGFVYDKYSFEASDARFEGAGEAKVHDNCNCQFVPTYDPPGRRVFTPKQEADFQTYLSLSPGGDQLLKFRRVYEGRPQEGDLAGTISTTPTPKVGSANDA